MLFPCPLKTCAFFLLITASLMAAEPERQPQPLKIVAHRGLLLHAPENTLVNFKVCLELKLGFEVDVRRSKDGQLVCVHDDTVDRTTNGSGAVVEMTVEQLKKLDAGGWFDETFAKQRIPTMGEVFALVAEYPAAAGLIAVDIKGEDERIEKDLVALAQQHKVLNRLLFIGRAINTPDVRRRLRQASKEAAVACVANTAEELGAAIADENSTWVYVRFLPTAAQVAQAHQAGKPVFIAGPTVAGHLPVNWQTAVDSGLDAVLTDHPLELRRLMRQPAR